MEITQTKKEPLDLTAQWILNSGIQSDGGGFHSWYDLKIKAHSYLYTEITGYGITTLLFLYGVSRDSALIQKAKQAADWVIKFSMHPCGGVKTRLYKDDDRADKRYSFSGENIFSFDTGMVLYSMIKLYQATKEEEFLKVSERLAQFLLDKMQNKNGSLSPIYNAGAAKIIEPGDKWSSQSGGFHAKVSLGLADLFKITEDKRYAEAAVRLCEYAVSTQSASGRLITDRISRVTHLHPHCYAAEGLWYTGVSFKVSKFIKSARKAAEWAFRNLSSYSINELQRSDVLAQLLRLGLIYSYKQIDELKSALLGYQYLGKDLSQRGGFLYTKGSQHINSWCSMFALQALAFSKDKKYIKTELFI